MVDLLKKKIGSLGEEANSLISRREEIMRMAQEIEVRLHQIAGAISEIDRVIKELEQDKQGDK